MSVSWEVFHIRWLSTKCFFVVDVATLRAGILSTGLVKYETGVRKVVIVCCFIYWIIFRFLTQINF